MIVLVCGVGGAVGMQRLTGDEEALALARPVEVGQALTTQDLVQVSLRVSDGVDLVPASATSTVLGKPAAYRLPAGLLLTASAVGQPKVPAQGRAIAAVALKPGQYPPNLSAGASVIVLARPSGANPIGELRIWPAVVSVFENRRDMNLAVVSLELSESDAQAVASQQSEHVAVVLTAGGGR
ncbi:hypothetical protein ABZX92_12600 [Lentzea sp. NPDC006480]|uniref:hypothetical protein n=1 Tax=Lentzea sp. NPDC006480 TaxID=3157176 RepID=UPI0033A53DD4